MKESLKLSKEQLKKIGIEDNPKDLMQLSKQQFELKQKINELLNNIWKLKNSKLQYEQQYARLEKDKDKMFVELGLKEVKRLEKE